jgi:hypothetical protein
MLADPALARLADPALARLADHGSRAVDRPGRARRERAGFSPGPP